MVGNPGSEQSQSGDSKLSVTSGSLRPTGSLCNGEPPRGVRAWDDTLITTMGPKEPETLTVMGRVSVFTVPPRGHLGEKRHLLGEVWGEAGPRVKSAFTHEAHPGSSTTPGFKPQLCTHSVVILGRLCNLSEHWCSHF